MSDPWRDPRAMSQHCSQREESMDERGSGGRDEILVPEFSGGKIEMGQRPEVT